MDLGVDRCRRTRVPKSRGLWTSAANITARALADLQSAAACCS